MTPTISRLALAALLISASILSAQPALAAVACGSGNFDAWLADFKTDAAAKGISQQAISAGLTGVTLDQSVLNRDRSQKVFTQTFEEFSGRMVPPRMTRGSNMMKQYGSVLSRIEQTYGVPGEVLVAIWGLETDFGVNTGKFATIRSLATLAYDCRRAEQFRAELLDALRIVQRGDLAPADMKGAWARRARPDPVHAVLLDEICRRFRRQRQARSSAQRPRRARLHRELSRWLWLAARQGLAAWRPEFCGAPAVE
ncbi:membrane-bound lytic murein transglycosylase B [Bradyrhizobium sp. LB9.1b]